jgi:hypothetical protein
VSDDRRFGEDDAGVDDRPSRRRLVRALAGGLAGLAVVGGLAACGGEGAGEADDEDEDAEGDDIGGDEGEGDEEGS